MATTSNMECPSCYEFFDAETRVPRNLNCGHTFCEECLVKIEEQKLGLCPICRTALQKPFKAKKLPKNFIALDYAVKQQELMKKVGFCQTHTKELMRHYCITCKALICIECIVDHSGHEFVRKEESSYILKESADTLVQQLDQMSERTEQLLQESSEVQREMKLRKVRDIKQFEERVGKLVEQLLVKKAQLKREYCVAFRGEMERVEREQEGFQSHLSLIAFNKDTILKTVQELEQFQGKKIQGSELSNKLENFKRQEEELKGQTDKLSSIKVSYPAFDLNVAEFERALKTVASVSHRTVMMTNKKINFFGDANKVMSLDLLTQKWTLKSLTSKALGSNSANEFLYYSAAVTLPNGDALIIGGGSSTAVYQYVVAKEELIVKRSMNQMRKEHAAVISGNIVYVMGGYDGMQSQFLNQCEQYNVEKNEWSYFAPMNISKCAFSATLVGSPPQIYTFGGYDGLNRLQAIEKYHIGDGSWQLLRVKLQFPLSNCACFCAENNKVVIFGGGFSSGFSPYVELIDVVTCEWKTLPIMNEGRDLRNKVVYVDDVAYAVGGLNQKAEKFNYAKKQWTLMNEYPVNDNLDSWACALTFIPKEYPHLKAQSCASVSVNSGNVLGLLQEQEMTVDQILAQERIIDEEIQRDLERFKLEQEIEMDLNPDEIQIAGGSGGIIEGAVGKSLLQIRSSPNSQSQSPSVGGGNLLHSNSQDQSMLSASQASNNNSNNGSNIGGAGSANVRQQRAGYPSSSSGAAHR